MLRGKNKEFYPLKSTGINSLKKIFILLIIAVLALAFDGTLSKDIFDYQLSGFADWMTAILIIAILLTIAWADSAKSDDNKNIPE
jgi:undecaprenyl pyrophosphate phosphatase UppP